MVMSVDSHARDIFEVTLLGKEILDMLRKREHKLKDSNKSPGLYTIGDVTVLVRQHSSVNVTENQVASALRKLGKLGLVNGSVINLITTYSVNLAAIERIYDSARRSCLTQKHATTIALQHE